MYNYRFIKNLLVAMMICVFSISLIWAQEDVTTDPAQGEGIVSDQSQDAVVKQEDSKGKAKKQKAKKNVKKAKEKTPEEIEAEAKKAEEDKEALRQRKADADAEKRRIAERNARKQRNARDEQILKKKETSQRLKQTKDEIKSLNKHITEINKNISVLTKQKDLVVNEIISTNDKEKLTALVAKRDELSQAIIEENEKVEDDKVKIRQLEGVLAQLLDVFELADGTLNWSKDYNISDKTKFTNGKWSVHVKAMDDKNNVSEVVARNVVIDPKSDIPTLNIINPVPRARIPGNLKIVGTAFDDDAVDKVELVVDAEKEKRTALGTDFWYYDLETSDLKDGRHVVKVKCYDINGTPSREYEVEFNLDRRTPFIDIVTIQSGEVVSGKIDIGGTASDDNGIENVEYSLDDRETFYPIHNVRAADAFRTRVSYSVKINTEQLADGVQNIWLRSKDGAGSIAYYPLTLVVDHEVPTLNFQYPKNRDHVGSKFTILGFAKDNLDIGKLEVSINNGAWEEVGMLPGNPYWSYIVDVSNVKPGRCNIKARVSDVSGNTTSYACDVVVDPGKKPKLVLKSLSQDQSVFDSLQLYGDLADDNGIKEVRVDISREGSPDIIYSVNVPSKLTFSTDIDLADTSKFSDGRYMVQCVPINLSGNEGDPATGTFIIDRGAPSIDADSVRASVAGRTFSKTVDIKNIKVHKGGALKNIKYTIKDMETNEVIADGKEIGYKNSNVPGEYIIDPITETIGEAEKGRILSMKIDVTDANDKTASISFPFAVDSTDPVVRKEFKITDEDGAVGEGIFGIMDNVGLREVKVTIQSTDKSWKQDDTVLSPDGKGLPFGDIVAIELPKKDVKNTAVSYTITVTAKDAAGNETKEEQKIDFKGDLENAFVVKFTAVNNPAAVPNVGPKLVLESNQVGLSDISNVVYAVMPVGASGVRLASPKGINIEGVKVNEEFGLWLMQFSSRDINQLSPGMTQFAVGGVVGGAPQNAGTFSISKATSEPKSRLLWPPSSLCFNTDISMYILGTNDDGTVSAEYSIDNEDSYTAVNAERIENMVNYSVPNIDPVLRNTTENLAVYARNNKFILNSLTDKLFKIDIPVTQLTNGVHKVYTKIKDTSGKVSTKTMEFYYNNEEPKITIWSPNPEGGDKFNGQISIRGESVNAQAVVAVHGVEEIVATGSARWDLLYDLTTLPEANIAPGETVEHDIKLYAIDKAGNRAETILKVFIDNSTDKPEVVINSPAVMDQRFTDIIEIGGVALDDDGVDFVQYRIDYGDPGSVLDKVKKEEVQWSRIDMEKGNPNWSKKLPKDAVQSGRHRLEVQAIDMYGVASDIQEIFFHVDNENPDITISQPQTGEYLRGETTITGRAKDPNEIEYVEISTNYGWTYSRAEGNASWAYYFDSRSVPDGPLRVLIRARDRAGSEAFSFALYNIDNTEPEIDILLPKDGMALNNVYKVVGRAKDNVGIDKVQLYVDGNLDSPRQIYGTETEGIDRGFFELDGLEAWEFDLDTSNLTRLDKYQLVARVTDLSGNTTEKSLNFTVNQMSDFPNLILDQPQPGQHLSGRTIDFFGTAFDDDAIDRVELKVDQGDYVVVRGTTMWNYSMSTVGLQPGAHVVSVVAYEKPVNEGDTPKQRSMTRQFYYDDNGPSIDVTSHINGAPMEHRPWMEGTANYFEDNLEFKLKEQIQRRKFLDFKLKNRRDVAAIQKMQENIDQIPVTPNELNALKRKYLAENEISAVYLSLDNGNTYTKCLPNPTPNQWKVRVQTQYLKDGSHVLQLKAVTKNGKEALRYFRVEINRHIPTIIIDKPMDSEHINDRLVVQGSADDDGTVENVKILFRKHDKNLGKVPQFVQGLYLWLQVFGGPYVSGGFGLSFFDDIVRVEAMFGWVPTQTNMTDMGIALDDPRFFTPKFGWRNSKYEPRFSGFVTGGKMLARIIDIPYEFFFGEDAKNFSFSVELGCAFYWFSGYGAGSTESYNLCQDKSNKALWKDSAYYKSKVLAGFMVQADLFKVERWAIFRKFAFYFEAAFFFVASETEGGLFPQFGFGLRNALF